MRGHGVYGTLYEYRLQLNSRGAGPVPDTGPGFSRNTSGPTGCGEGWALAWAALPGGRPSPGFRRGRRNLPLPLGEVKRRRPCSASEEDGSATRPWSPEATRYGWVSAFEGLTEGSREGAASCPLTIPSWAARGHPQGAPLRERAWSLIGGGVRGRQRFPWWDPGTASRGVALGKSRKPTTG